MGNRSLPFLSDTAARKILKELCIQHKVSIDLLTQMIEIQRENLGRARQIGITQEFSAAIAEFLDASSTGQGR